VRTGECLKQFTGHQEMILDFAVNNDGRFLVSAGDDGVCLVFSITSTTEM
jgi:ribosome assembly protein SQT1